MRFFLWIIFCTIFQGPKKKNITKSGNNRNREKNSDFPSNFLRIQTKRQEETTSTETFTNLKLKAH